MIAGECACEDPNGACIMAAFVSFPPPTLWSNCSRMDLAFGFSFFGIDECLFNNPEITVADPVCGNGIKERQEECDCGTPVVVNMLSLHFFILICFCSENLSLIKFLKNVSNRNSTPKQWWKYRYWFYHFE